MFDAFSGSKISVGNDRLAWNNFLANATGLDDERPITVHCKWRLPELCKSVNTDGFFRTFPYKKYTKMKIAVGTNMLNGERALVLQKNR